jgi:hypothetical protein
VKKLLILQLDDAYFLFETLAVLDKSFLAFNDFEVTVLARKENLTMARTHFSHLRVSFISEASSLSSIKFDVSCNLSLSEESWNLHEQISSVHKIGAYYNKGSLQVEDQWSSYYLTVKGRAPFLTYHLQDIFRNILGIKQNFEVNRVAQSVSQIVFGLTSPALFAAEDQECFITMLSKKHPHLKVIDISEVDLISDLSRTLYIGPTSVKALQICEAGARGVFLERHFQGFNLLPGNEGNFVLSSRGQAFKAVELLSWIEKLLKKDSKLGDSPYSVYTIEKENIFGSYLKSLNTSDDNYPFYLSHIVLWNFLLNLYDTHLDIITCTESQMKLLKENREVLTKLIRLHDYAMSSIDTIHTEAKQKGSDSSQIQGHLNNLREIETVNEKIASTHPFLRPFIDYYRIRRGQNQGNTLLEQARDTFLAYTEEHQALKALEELFIVTLRKNEVNL